MKTRKNRTSRVGSFLAAAETAAAENRRSQREYDAAQTEKCNRLRALLQSIAALAVDAQDMDPSGDPLTDQLDAIADDLARAQRFQAALQRDDVFAEVK
jgi:hypothetical protein